MSQEGNHEKQQDSLQERLLSDEFKHKGICMHPGCVNKVDMKSHVLQKRGILSHIAPNGKVREITEGRLLHPTSIESQGVNNSRLLTFRGLCKKHDDEDFSELEKANADKDILSYRQHLLLSYRALLNELSGARTVVRYQTKAINNTALDLERRKRLQRMAPKAIMASKDVEHYKLIMDGELWFEDSTQHFHFHRRILSKVEIATSAVFGEAFLPEPITPELPWGLTVPQAMALNPENRGYTPRTPVIFLHLIPRETDLLMVLGYNKSVTEIKGRFTSSIDTMADAEIFKLLSDILVSIQTWCMSEALYNKWADQGVIKGMLSARKDFWANARRRIGQPRKAVSFNMFDTV